ncbi:MAG: hypothetical protein PHT95_00725 [Candidatus Omnitrophica bacterium]|nr:hypothetical protein [Candidatus Omnitrophota bacterium]MDD4012889.1 hypothetical protein [Candidatus Omnitrophota bacterium]
MTGTSDPQKIRISVKISSIFSLISLLVILSAAGGHAYAGQTYTWPKSSKRDFVGNLKDPLEIKFFKVVNRVLDQKNRIALTGDQAMKVRNLSGELRLRLIEIDEDIETVTVSANTLMWEDPFNVEGINLIAAEKHSLTEKRNAAVISSFNQLKMILTTEQKKAFRELQ